MGEIRIGSVVRDSVGRVGIVLAGDTAPTREWLAEQQVNLAAGPPQASSWWSVMPLTGGMLLVPESALTPLRQATYEDFIAAVHHAQPEGRRRLGFIFPAFLRRAMTKAPDAQGEA